MTISCLAHLLRLFMPASSQKYHSSAEINWTKAQWAVAGLPADTDQDLINDAVAFGLTNFTQVQELMSYYSVDPPRDRLIILGIIPSVREHSISDLLALRVITRSRLPVAIS